MRPLNAAAFLDEIAKTRPLKFTLGDGTPEFDLSLADANDFPIAPARAVLNVYLLANPERVWPERNNLIHCHSIPGCGAPSPIGTKLFCKRSQV